MSNHRGGYEFPPGVKNLAFDRAGHRCEICGQSPDEGAELALHHIVPIGAIHKFFPQLSAVVVKSLYNSLVVCHDCHQREDIESWQMYDENIKTLIMKYLVHMFIATEAEIFQFAPIEDPVEMASLE